MLEVKRRLIHEIAKFKIVWSVKRAQRKNGGAHAMPG